MSWFFGRAKPALEVHASLSREELSHLAQTLLEFAERSLFAAAPLVISPGSIRSVSFLRELETICQKLEKDPTNPKNLKKIQEELAEKQVEFGEWQRQQSQQIVDDFTSSLESIVQACQQSFEGQDQTIGHLNKMQGRLSQVRESQDLVQIRETLRQEVESAKNLIKQQAEASEALRQEFTGMVKAMQKRLVEAEESAQVDHLTRLGNRAAFEFYGEATLNKLSYGEVRRYSVGLLDLDGFKAINDNLGHEAGDQVLNAFAGRLRRQFPKPAFVGRFGGDEFVVIGLCTAAEMTRKLEELDKDLSRHPIQVIAKANHQTVKLGVSAGCRDMNAGDELKKLLNEADEAMYAHKRARKAQVRAA